jgi:hypothetical protein
LLLFLLLWVFCFGLVFGGIRDGTQGLVLARQMFCHLSHVASHFSSDYSREPPRLAVK